MTDRQTETYRKRDEYVRRKDYEEETSVCVCMRGMLS